jgi:NAD(P)H-dependent FMN reductase
MPTTPHIVIIVASIRPTRFAEHPLKWILAETPKHPEFTFEVLDLRDAALPTYDQPGSPAMRPREYGSDAEREIGKKLDAADGFLVIANEYNHGYTSAIKNLLDSFFVEWNRKPISFVGYGNVGGARAIEQLRLVADELDMASVRPTVNLLGPQIMAIRGGADTLQALAELQPRLEALLGDLHWWATALKTARDADREATDATDEGA